jgi:hypothetical protein
MKGFTMLIPILMQVNYLAVAVCSVLFFVIGSVWFSPVGFSTLWVKELERHNVQIKQPSSQQLTIKMLLTFGANVLAVLAMACLVVLTGSFTVMTGLMLGKIVALGFACTAIGSVFIWESRSLKLFLIDAGYPAVGIIVAAVILSVWR